MRKKNIILHLSGSGQGQWVVTILILWSLLNTFLIFKQGIITTGEAAKYIETAQYFLNNGHLPSTNFQYYSIIVFLLALSLKLHMGFAPLVAIQLLCNLAATLYFFDTARKIFNSWKIAFIAAALLLFNYPYQAFNTAVQTESLFQSLSLILSCYLLRKEKLQIGHFIFTAFSILLLSLNRPIGLLYIPAAFVYFYLVSLRKVSPLTRLSFAILIIAGFLYLLDRAMGSGGEYDFMLPFREEHIICGVPTLLHPIDIHTPGNGNSVYALIYYIFHHPGQFLRLAFLKSLSFWGVYRSYFSIRHNIPLVAYFYAMILLAILSMKYWVKAHIYKLTYLLTLMLVTWMTVILTCDDWNHRIFLSISPYLTLLAAGFFKRIFPSQERPL